MCECSGDMHFICVEAQTLVKKQCSFKVYFITPYSLFSSSSSIPFSCDGSITIMWSYNIFINDFQLPYRRAGP